MCSRSEATGGVPSASQRPTDSRALRLADTIRGLEADGNTVVAVGRDGTLLGITEVRAEVTPDGKAGLARRLQEQGAKVAMEGDGINDAPALMQADVGIALGSGADIATESADIIIVRDDPSRIFTARKISCGSYRRRVKQNVALAFTFNGIGIPLATTGLVHPMRA